MLVFRLQQVNNRFVAVLGGPDKRSPAVLFLRVGIDLARSEKQLNNSFVSVPGGPAKRRPAVAVLLIDLAYGEKSLHHYVIAIFSGPM